MIIFIFPCSGCSGPQNTLSGPVISGSVKNCTNTEKKYARFLWVGNRAQTFVTPFQIETTHFANQTGPSAVICMYIVVVDARQKSMYYVIVCRVQLTTRYRISTDRWLIGVSPLVVCGSSYCTHPTTQLLLLFRSPPQVLVATLLEHKTVLTGVFTLTLGVRLVCCY